MQFCWTQYTTHNNRKAYRLLDQNQRIVGRVTEFVIPGNGREFDAHCYLKNDPRLGRFLSLERAQQRVEEVAGVRTEVAA